MQRSIVGRPNSQFVLTPVADVEKLDISEIGTNLGDRKCLGDSRESFIGHPDTIYFLRIGSLKPVPHPSICLEDDLVLTFSADGQM